MGTNFYRIPTSEEVERRRTKLIKRISNLDCVNVSDVSNKFDNIPHGDWEHISPWGEFTDGMSIHLGKRSMGWKFLWNFNGNKYYKTKDELFKFIRSGRIVDEYGKKQDTEEFIKMTLEWGQPDGLVFNKEYEDKISKENPNYWRHGRDHYDLIIDGLRVCTSTEFS